MSAKRTRLRRGRTALELSVLVVALVAIAAVITGLIVASVVGGEGPPDLRTSVAFPGTEGGGGIEYKVVVENRGGESAENVVIEITLGSETREIEILSVAKGDEEEASVVFPPGSTGRPTGRVLSYHSTTRG